jgi:glycosyltransferase involved in cell wall biosynthesis
MPAAEAFRRGRCLIVPSRAERLPYIVLEAAAARMPLIVTGVGGIPEIIRGSDTLLVPPDDVPALTSAMHGFLDVPQAAKERARRLEQRVRERFAMGTMAPAVLDFYADVRGR